jgi:indole-3-glycerol phosphate synthase
VNNRDLRVFKTDLATTERLAARLRVSPGGGEALLVAESGIRTRADVARLQRATAQAILVGESLMRVPDLAAKIAELLGTTPQGTR